MIRRPPRSTLSSSSAASDVYKRQILDRVSQECQRHGGALVLLWHNRYWSNLYAPVVREYFRNLLERCVAQGAAVDSISGLARLADATLASQVRLGAG